MLPTFETAGGGGRTGSRLRGGRGKCREGGGVGRRRGWRRADESVIGRCRCMCRQLEVGRHTGFWMAFKSITASGVGLPWYGEQVWVHKG